MNQRHNAAPTKKEFDTLNTTVSNLSDHIESMLKLVSKEINLGALANGSYGLVSTVLTIPTGYEIVAVTANLQHSGALAGRVQLTVGFNESTIYTSYYAHVGASSTDTSINLVALCARSDSVS